MTRTQTKGCVHIAHVEGYHELIWYDNSHTTVDEYIAHITHIYNTLPADTHLLRYLVRDGGMNGLPAINYFSAKVREVEKKYPNRPNTRSALVYGGGVKLLLLNAMITLTNLRGRDAARFFEVGNEDNALAWVLQS